jgi:hypothetical protein
MRPARHRAPQHRHLVTTRDGSGAWPRSRAALHTIDTS